MTTYQQYNNAFANDDNDGLDQMARQVNNNKKKLNKRAQSGFNKQQKENCVGINCLMDQSNARFAPPNLGDNFGFFSAQGDFSSKLPTPLLTNNKYDDSASSKFNDNSSMNTFNTNNTNNTFSTSNVNINSSDDQINSFSSKMINIESDISSSYSSLPQKIKSHLRSTTKHLKKYDETDEKNTVNHLKTCSQCRSEFFNLLQEEHHIFKNSANTNANTNANNNVSTNVNNNDQLQKPQTGGILNLSTPELKDILILILIGVVIIILLDIFIRK